LENIPGDKMKTLEFTAPDGKTLSVDSPDGSTPSEQELDQMFAEKYGNTTTQQPTSQPTQAAPQEQGFTEAQFEPTPSTISPTNFKQDLMLGLAANDERRMEYLAREFQGAKVDNDPEMGLMVNGTPVNPKGFDKGDIARNAGYVFPFAGQVVGSILGAGATPELLGAGAIPGGVAGSTVGEGVRLAVGELLGLSQDGQDVFNSVSDNAKNAVIGEVLGLGIAGAGVGIKGAMGKLGQTKFAKGAADIWQKAMSKNPEMATFIARFVGNVDEGAARIATQKFRPKDVLNETYFDPSKTLKITNKILFGKENVPAFENLISGSGVQGGTKMLAQSIKEMDDVGFDKFVQYISKGGISDDTLDIIKKTHLDKLFDPNNMSDDAAYKISQSMVQAVDAHKAKLGKSIESVERKALRDIGTENFNITPIKKDIDAILKQTGLTKRIKVDGYDTSFPPDIKGRDLLMKMREQFGSLVTEKDAQGNAVKVWKFYKDGVTNNQAKVISNRLDMLADEVFKNKNIPSEIKNSVRLLKESFVTKYHNALGLSEEALDYHNFMKLTDDFKINSVNGNIGLENTIKSFRTLSEAKTSQLGAILDAMPEGKIIQDRIGLQAAGKELKALNIKNMAGELERNLNSPSLLKLNKMPLDEDILVGVDRAFRNSKNKALNGKAFYDDAQKSLAAKEFLKSSTNILRVSTISSILGLGGLGMATGGPLGGAIGGIAALTLTNPKNIASMLVAMDKGVVGRSISGGAGKVKSVLGSQASRSLLNRLISQKASEK
jgi:hypothetical protein